MKNIWEYWTGDVIYIILSFSKGRVFKMKRVITFSSLVAAVAVYLAGSALGALIFFIVGAVFESIFWFRLFRRKEIV